MIALAGCLAQEKGQEIQKRMPYIDVVFGTNNLHRLPDLILEAQKTGEKQCELYENLPEEIPYYLKRMQTGWNSLFFANIIINFATPFLALMRRNSKRQMDYLFAVCIILLVGRYIDWYLLSMPGMVAAKAGFGLLEIGIFLSFLGTFGFVSAKALTKANLVPVNHPYLEESYHHQI
jgi:hypothetical protein